MKATKLCRTVWKSESSQNNAALRDSAAPVSDVPRQEADSFCGETAKMWFEMVWSRSRNGHRAESLMNVVEHCSRKGHWSAIKAMEAVANHAA